MANNKKKNIMKDLANHKREILIGGAFLLVVIVAIVFIVINNDNGTKESNNNVNNSEETENNQNNNEEIDMTDSEFVTEDQMIEAYNFSKEDAKNLVMSNFNSDNFEYIVTISDDAMYIVEVKNIITENVYRYEVNPSTKTAVEL